MTTAPPLPSCRLDALPADSVQELIAHAPLPPTAPWPPQPGALVRDPGGMPQVLHFAPGRWLLTGAAAGAGADVAAEADYARRVDVTGKWQAYALTGAGAATLLANTLSPEAVLLGRQCAAVSLFDCPCVLARIEAGFAIWVQASYAAHLRQLCQSLGAQDTAPGADALAADFYL